MIRVCLAGATGWAGSELARGIARTTDVALVSAVARRHAGEQLGDVLHEPLLTGRVYASAADGLTNPCDVFVEYTKPDAAKANILAAVDRGAHVVVGTSGLTEEDFTEIDEVARRQARGVLACGTFALTVVLLQRFAEMAARLIPQWEIIDYAHSPPGFVISAEIIFGMPDQKVTIRHHLGSSAVPYVDGALLAIRRVGTLVGLHRGLETVLDL